MKKSVGVIALCLVFYHTTFSQVDTSFIYKTGTPFGTLDIRVAESSTRYWYLQEGKTFSFRESSPGVKTGTYRDMTSWDSSPYTQGNLRKKNGTLDDFIMNYRLLFPVGYTPAVAEGYPIIIMVHGLGERANCWDNTCYWGDRNWRPATNTPAAPTTVNHELLNNDHNLLHGGQVHLGARNLAGSKDPNDPTLPTRSFPGFVLFPQNLNGWDSGTDQDVIRIIRLLMKKYKIDPNRVYIHGLSNGGAAVYDIIKRAPWLFAATATMSAVNDGGLITQNLVSKVAHIPLWTFQGGQDTNPTPGRTETFVKKFREAGMIVRYSKYPNLGHGTWGTAYNEPDFFTWLRSKNKTKIHVFADNPTLCTTTGQGVKLELAEGFLAYQWERNGVIISGATAASYMATTVGTYRARFSRVSNPTETQWNKWSDPVSVVSSSPAQAQIVQTGTVLLKDLNYSNDARLSSAAAADHYYWYKNGVLVDLPGNLDDTTRNPIFRSGDCSTGTCVGNGVYTLVTAGFNNCPSPVSAPKYVYFSDQAPVNITAPTTFTGNATSPTTATVNWTDAATNETGYEIWRRKVLTSTTFTKWAMAKLTNANVTSLADIGLDPGATYQYKIRAVSNSGRSNYTPSASNQYLVITTTGETQPPTIPQNLVAASTNIGEITLTWQASTDNTGIREYNIYYGSTVVGTGSAVTTYKFTNLPLNTNYSFTVKAKDLAGNLSGASNAAAGTTYVTGLYYEHSTGAWSDIDLINWTAPAEFKGKVNNFTLAPRTQEDYFNFEFEGFVYINVGGDYQFQTSSDDGSRLTLDNNVIVDNDGLHGTVTITSAVLTLSNGGHRINVKYFENAGGQNLTVRYKGPDTGNAWVVIPDSALKSGNQGTMTMAAAEEPVIADDSTAATFAEPQLSVFPNPASSSENFSVQVETQGETPVAVQMIDMMGKSYFEKTFNADELKTAAVEITPAAKLQRGIYLIILKQGDYTVRSRVIVND